MWKNMLDSRDLTAIQPYVNDGTILGLYAIDEPHDWGCGPTFYQLNEVCRYAHQRLPEIACGFNTSPAWLRPGASQLDQLDYLFTQTNFNRVPNTSDWVAWADQTALDASWFSGPLYLSINAYTGSPTAAQVRDAAIALCDHPASSGVMMWKWTYVSGWTTQLQQAVEACSN
jgi:hypothetical protein